MYSEIAFHELLPFHLYQIHKFNHDIFSVWTMFFPEFLILFNTFEGAEEAISACMA